MGERQTPNCRGWREVSRSPREREGGGKARLGFWFGVVRLEREGLAQSALALLEHPVRRRLEQLARVGVEQRVEFARDRAAEERDPPDVRLERARLVRLAGERVHAVDVRHKVGFGRLDLVHGLVVGDLCREGGPRCKGERASDLMQRVKADALSM